MLVQRSYGVWVNVMCFFCYFHFLPCSFGLNHFNAYCSNLCRIMLQNILMMHLNASQN